MAATNPWPQSEEMMKVVVLRRLSLSPRQQALLQLLANGKTMKEVANLWDISEQMVKWHAFSAYDKLRKLGYPVVNVASAVAVCVRQGWIE